MTSVPQLRTKHESQVRLTTTPHIDQNNSGSVATTSPIFLRPWVQVPQVKPRYLDTLDIHKYARVLGQRNVLHGARETLVLLGIVVLQTDLDFDGLGEVPLFRLGGMLEDGAHTFVECVPRNLGPARRQEVSYLRT